MRYRGVRCVGSSPLSPPRYVPCILFYREKDSALPSLVDSRRIVHTHATVSALDTLCQSLGENKTPYGDSNPRHQSTLLVVVFEVNHFVDYRGDRRCGGYTHNPLEGLGGTW